MRSHSVSAEGGTVQCYLKKKATIRNLTFMIPSKAVTFLADQDVAERLVSNIPYEIYQLDHWGMPWSRRRDGRIGQRKFGGVFVSRATYAQDKVGFYEMQALYDTCLKYDNIHFYNEWFCTAIC